MIEIGNEDFPCAVEALDPQLLVAHHLDRIACALEDLAVAFTVKKESGIIYPETIRVEVIE